MLRLLRLIAEVLRKHGTLRSDFYQLYSAEAFQGFACIANTLSATPDEEVWVELDHYREREHRDQVMHELRTDASAGALFRQLGGAVSDGYSIVMGELVAV
jgi:hypothetical protein